MHGRWGGTGGSMVSGSNEQRSQHHSKEAQDMRQIEEVVERRHQRPKRSSSKRKTKKTEFGGGHPGEGRAPEVDLAVPEPNVEWLLAEPQGSRGVESSTMHQPSRGHDCGGHNGQRRQARKHSHREGGDATAQIVPPERRRPLLWATPSGQRTHTRHWASGRARPIISISQKAPGPDKLSFGATQQLWMWNEKRMVGLTKATIRTGRYSAVWMRARGVEFRKHGKDDYTKVKAYGAISLLSCMGKVVENVVAELSSEEAERSGPLSDGQFGSRKGQSAIDAVATIVDRAHAAWTHSHITGVLLMDIKAAFPTMAKGRLVNIMKIRQMDGDHIRWTKSFLSERMVAMIIEGNTMERHPVEAGVTQGSPVSPILFAIYTSGLIKWVDEYISAKGLSSVNNLGRVATGGDVDQVVTTLERYPAKSMEWASRRGIQFDTVKTEAALYMRRRGHKKHLRPQLTPKIKVGNGFIWFNKQATRWLRVRMDVHQVFKVHHNRCMKIPSAVEARLRTLRKPPGVVPERVWAVQGVWVQTVALDGSELWWDRKEEGRRDNLQHLLNRQARSVRGALTTTPKGSMNEGVMAHTRSCDLRLQTTTSAKCILVTGSL